MRNYGSSLVCNLETLTIHNQNQIFFLYSISLRTLVIDIKEESDKKKKTSYKDDKISLN